MRILITAFCLMCVMTLSLFARADSTGIKTDSIPGAKAARRQPTERSKRAVATGVFRSLDSALSNPDSVVHLLLGSKQIKSAALNLAAFKNVVTIDLSGCGLAEFPRTILGLSKLASLNLSDNPIKSIPVEIGGLVNLARLTLRNTGVTTLPSTIQRCQQLANLELSGSPIQSLPIAELNKLPRLRSIGLGGWKDPGSTPVDASKPDDAKASRGKSTTPTKK